MADPVEEEGGGSKASESRLREGERRTVTVLFSDLKGAATLSEGADPEDMDRLMTGVFSRFETCVRARGGAVEKYIGDALVAVFGYPDIHEDDPARAVEAALDFHRAMEGAKGRRKNGAGLPPGEGRPGDGSSPQPRTGIHTGLVATGRRGRFDVVTGHTMAVASRLQSAAAPGAILVSGQTRAKCESRFIFGEGEELRVKGKDEPVSAWRILGRKRGNPSAEGPFLGRDAELERLVAGYVRSLREPLPGFYLTGDGGIGKTRLCAEFLCRLRRFPSWGATVLALNPGQAGAGDWAALAVAVRDRLDLAPDCEAVEMAAAARERLGLDPEVAAAAAGILSGLRTEERSGGTGRHRDPGEAVAALVDALLAMDGGLYPDIILVDNARGLDQPTRSLLGRLVAEGRERPFFLLADRLPDPSLEALLRSPERVSLAPLSDEDSARLVRALDPEGADERSVGLVVSRSQGYPLFIEEYVKLLRRDREIGGVPDSVQNAVLSSIDRLDPGIKTFLQKLSVLRLPFGAAEAAELHARTGADRSFDAAAALALLEEERLLLLQPDGRYRWRHAIIKEAVYDSLLNHNKRILHQAAAAMKGPGSGPAEVFRHLAAGELWEEARAFLLETRPSLPLDLAGLLQATIDRVPPEDSASRVELLFMKYATLYNHHATRGIEAILAEMYAIALRERSRAFLARVSHLYMTRQLAAMRLDEAVFHGERALGIYEETGNPRGEANARYFLAQCRILRGEFAAARELIEGIARSTPLGERHYAMGRSLWHFHRGDHGDCATWSDAAAGLLAEAEGRDPDAARRFMRVVNAQESLEFATALEDESSAPPAGKSEPEELSQYYAARALAVGRRGATERARALLDEAERTLLLSGDEAGLPSYRSLVAWTRHALGMGEEARSLAEATVIEASRLGNWLAYFELSVLLAALAREGGRRRDAAFWLGEANSLVDRPVLKARKMMIRYRWLAARLAEELGEEATAMIAEDPWESEAEARRLLAEELAALRGDEERRELLSLPLFAEMAKEGRGGEEGAGPA